MILSEEFRAFLTKLMNSLSDLLEGVNLDFNFDLMPGISMAGYVLLALGLFTGLSGSVLSLVRHISD